MSASTPASQKPMINMFSSFKSQHIQCGVCIQKPSQWETLNLHLKLLCSLVEKSLTFFYILSYVSYVLLPCHVLLFQFFPTCSTNQRQSRPAKTETSSGTSAQNDVLGRPWRAPSVPKVGEIMWNMTHKSLNIAQTSCEYQNIFLGLICDELRCRRWGVAMLHRVCKHKLQPKPLQNLTGTICCLEITVLRMIHTPNFLTYHLGYPGIIYGEYNVLSAILSGIYSIRHLSWQVGEKLTKKNNKIPPCMFFKQSVFTCHVNYSCTYNISHVLPFDRANTARSRLLPVAP